ncbi:MAG: hypothetical protein ACRELG_16320, partial [Gemmataceae bacterium]
MGVPNDVCFKGAITHIRSQVLGRMLIPSQRPILQQLIGYFQGSRLQRQQREWMEDQTAEALLQSQERQLATVLFQQSSIRLFINKLAEA